MRHMASAVTLVLVVLSCGVPDEPAPRLIEDGAPSQGGTVVIGLLSDVQSWNPYLAEDAGTHNLLALIYPSLAIEQADYRLHPPSFEPALATSWSWSEDHLELILKLEPAARWADGVPITAHDVVYTWTAQTSPEVDWIGAYAKDSIASVEAIGDHTVKVVFNRLYPYQMMDLNDGLILPAHVFGKIPLDQWRTTDWIDHVVAGGPFALTDHTPRQDITLERNPNYFRAGRPFLDRLVFRIATSDRALMTQLLAGELDFLRSVPPSDAERVRNTDGIKLVIYDDRSYTHICWNTTRPGLSDPQVRRALSMAIDRETLIDVVYRGFARLGAGPVLSSFWAFNRNLEPLPFDPTAARELLADSGWRDHDGDEIVDREGKQLTIELMAPAENELRQDIAILVQEDLRRIGVRAEPRFVEWGAMTAAMYSGDFEALVNLWEEPTQVDLGEIWHSPPPDQPTFNFGRWADPEVDDLLVQASQLPMFGDQKPHLDRIQEIIVASQPYTFLVENVRLTAHTHRIRGAQINAATPYFNIDEWYVETTVDAE